MGVRGDMKSAGGAAPSTPRAGGNGLMDSRAPRAGMPRRTSLAIRESKLDPPRPREGTIQRAELVDRLRFSPPANVTLIVAPAGYGKTTVLAELFRRSG